MGVPPQPGMPPGQMGGMPDPMGVPDPVTGVPGTGVPMGPPPPPPSPEELVMGMVDDLMPIYPKWIKFGANGTPTNIRKPSVAQCQSAITSDEMKFQRLVQRFLDDLRFYRKENSTIFDSLDPTDIELFTSTEASIQVDKVANMIHAIETQVQWAWSTEEEEEYAQIMEDWAKFFEETINQYHRFGGNADLKWDMAFSRLVYGRIVSRVLPDTADPDFPWDYRLYDPATVFPTFGTKRGLVRVSCVYEETLDRVLQTFDTDDRNLDAAFRKHYAKREIDADLNHIGTLKEYWDPWYRYVEFDGVTVLPVTAHELGYVPFIYTVGTGELGNAGTPDRKKEYTAREILAGHTGFGEQADMVHKGLSFFHHMKPVIRQEESVMSLSMTSLKQSLEPPVWIESAYEGPAQEIDFRSGASNKGRPGERVTPLLANTKSTDMGPVLTNLREQRVKGMLPDQVFGASEGSNVSGFAVESLIAAAKDRIQPVITDIELHLAEIIDMAARQYRDVGHLIVDDIGGAYPIPVQRRHYEASAATNPGVQSPPLGQLAQMMGVSFPGSEIPAAFDIGMRDVNIPAEQEKAPSLTRDIILAIGSRPKVRLHSIALQNMTAMVNVASMAVREKIWSRSHAMEEMNVPNPQLMWKQILSEDAQTNPKMLELVLFPQALLQSGNIDAYMAYIATVIIPQMMQAQMAMMGGPGGGMGAPGEGGGGPETFQGASQPMVDQGPGSPSGPGNGGFAGMM